MQFKYSASVRVINMTQNVLCIRVHHAYSSPCFLFHLTQHLSSLSYDTKCSLYQSHGHSCFWFHLMQHLSHLICHPFSCIMIAVRPHETGQHCLPNTLISVLGQALRSFLIPWGSGFEFIR